MFPTNIEVSFLNL